MNYLLLVSASYVTGILSEHYLPKEPAIFLLSFSLLALLGISVLLRATPPAIRYCIFPALLSLLFFGLGFFFLNMCCDQIDALPPHHLTYYLAEDINSTPLPLTFTGRIAEPPEYFSDKIHLRLEVQKIIFPKQNIMTSGTVLLNWYNPPSNIRCRFYDTVQVTARLHTPLDYKNPGGFSYTDYLHRQGICATGSIRNLSVCTTAKTVPCTGRILRWIYEFRFYVSEHIEKTTSAPYSHLLQALLLGEKHKVSGQIKALFSEAGVAHLLCISGLHLAILAFFIFSCFKLALRALPDRLFEALTCLIKPSSLAAVLSMPAVIFYTILTGSKTATVRACTMIICYFLALLLDRKKDLWRPLILAAFCILLWQPEALFRIDFQLTFLATAGIIFMLEYLPVRLSRDKFEEGLPSRFRLKRYFLCSLYISLMTFIVICPLAAYTFNQISLAGILVNVVAIPLLTLILYTGLTAILALSLWPYPAYFLFRVAALMTHLMITINASAIKVPGAFFYLISPSKTCLLAIYGCTFMSALLFRYWAKRPPSARRILLLFPSLAWPLLFLFFTARTPQPVPALLKATFLDVGRGDSCVIQTPAGKNILIDGGGAYDNNYDFGRWVLAPYLWHEQIRKLDLVILSHPHPDHLNGLLFVLKNFPAAQLWKTQERADYPEYQLFEEILREKKIPVRIMAGGERFSLDNIRMEILSPPRSSAPLPPKSTSKSKNNRSLVFKLSYGQTSFLFTGDIELAAEKRLLALGEKLRATILKVPHHGSRYSSSPSFLEAVSPQVAVFSARKSGIYPFPHPTTLDRYLCLKPPARIYRTDRDGAVTIETDGAGFRVFTDSEMSGVKAENRLE